MRRTVLGGAAAVLLVAGCSSAADPAPSAPAPSSTSLSVVASPSPTPSPTGSADDLLTSARAGLGARAVDGFHVTGTDLRYAAGPVELDLVMSTNATQGTATLGGVPATFRTTGGRTWAKGPAAFWLAAAKGFTAAEAAAIDDVWTEVPGFEPVGQYGLAAAFPLSVIADGDAGPPTFDEPIRIDGGPVYTVVRQDGRIWVTVGDRPVLRRVDIDNGRLDFTLDAGVPDVTPPSAAEVVPWPRAGALDGD